MPIDVTTHKSLLNQIARQQTLKLDKDTTMEQLGTFLASKSGKASILAERDSEGNTILYTRKSTGADFFRNLKDRLTKTEDKQDSLYDHKRKLANTLISDFLVQQSERIKTSVSELEAQVGKSKTLAVSTFNIFRTASANYTGKADFGDAARVGNTVTLLTSLELLESRVTRSLESHRAIMEPIPDLPPTDNEALPEMRRLSFDLHGSPQTLDAPVLKIAGKIFTPSEVTGMGGFGAVVRYVGPDREPLAVKLPAPSPVEDRDTIAAQRKKASLEVFNTGRMIRDNPNATGFTDHVNLPNGMVALIGEHLSKGDLHAMAEKIASVHETGPSEIPPPPGKIGDFERYIVSLTLLKDAASGLAGIGENGMTHGDVKSQNVMLGADGRAKVIDLGEGVMTSKVAPDVTSMPQNPEYIAPEYGILADKARSSQNPEARKLNKQMLDGGLEAILGSLTSIRERYDDTNRNRLDGNFTDAIGKIEKDLRSLSPRLNNGNLKIGQSFDGFGLGTIGLQLLAGGSTLDEKPERGTILAYMENWALSKNPAIGPGGLRQRGFDFGESNALLNAMLDSNPKTRLTPAQVRDHEMLKHPAVGSPEVRTLILAIQEGNSDTISKAVSTFRDAFKTDP